MLLTSKVIKIFYLIDDFLRVFDFSIKDKN